MTAATPRPLHKIADEILAKWPLAGPAAVGYVKAMRYLATLDDKYGKEDAESIVIRFLVNAQSWRGEDARRIKAELRQILRQKGVV
jgi:hypothetical protein